jgi:hypothetical protein
MSQRTIVSPPQIGCEDFSGAKRATGRQFRIVPFQAETNCAIGADRESELKTPLFSVTQTEDLSSTSVRDPFLL